MRPGLRSHAALLLPALLLLTVPADTGASQTPPNVRDGDTPGNLLVGTVTRADLKEAPFSEWFDREYRNYEPVMETVRALAGHIDSVSVEIYFGSWCGDSKREVPRMMRVLDLAGLDEGQLSLVALSDRPMEFMKAPGNPQVGALVHRTPTFIVRRGGKEIGRIVETATTTLEGDLLAIVEGRAPLPKFGAEALVYRLVLDHSGEEAEDALRKAGARILELGDPGSLWHYAEFDLLKNDRAHEARAVIELYLQVEPKSVRGHLILSDALAALGHKDEALAAVGRALELEPRNERALRAAEALRRP